MSLTIKKHSLDFDCFLGIEIRQIRDSRTKVFVYFNDQEPAQAIVDKHSRTCGGRRISVSKAQVINKVETLKSSTTQHKKKRSHRSKNKKSLSDQMENMNLDELYPLQATYYYQPQQQQTQQEMYYQQSEASFTTIDSGFDAHEMVVSPPPPIPQSAYAPIDLQPTIVMPDTCVFCIIGAPHPDQTQLANMHNGDNGFLSTLTPEQYSAFMAVMSPQVPPQAPPPPAYYNDVY